MSLFIQAIPYNFYALLTIVMMIFIAVSKFDYGPMKKYEAAAKKGEALGADAQLSKPEIGNLVKIVDRLVKEYKLDQ